ncbi:MAG: hypothetical protein P8Y95_13565 [Gammaproteobacteria bacterium]
MSARKTGIGVAVAIIAIGIAWLLNSVGVLPAIEWLWTLGLAVTGVLVLGLLGVDKVTAVLGPFLLISSAFSIVRQLGWVTLSYEVPLLVIIFGVLLLVAVVSPLQKPAWLLGEEEAGG